jgi:TolB protein
MKYASGRRRGKLFGQPPKRPPFLPISLVLLALIILVFALVPTSVLTPEILQPVGLKVPTATASATPLPAPTRVHGGHIVFTCTRNEINQICFINADGTGFKQLTDVTTNAYYPAIAPDGESVVYAENKYDNFDIYLLVLSNSKLFQLTSNVGNSFSPDFSPDGKQIVFVNKAADGPSSLWVMGRTGENPRLLYAGPNTIVGAAWSPDGKTIAFAMAVNLLYAYEIFLLDVNTPTSPRQLSHDLQGIGGSLSWSRDSKDLLIFAGPVDAREIYRLDAATGDATQMTFGGNNASASYSPDGQWIVYNSLRNDNQADLFIMRADGHQTRQLTAYPEPDWQPEWGP